MAEFNGQIVTNEGRNLLSRALAGQGKVIFTKAAFGDQRHSGNLREVTELKNKKIDLAVMNIRNDNGTAVLTVQISNENVEESFRTEEFGVYAKIENDPNEILYSYTTAVEADFFPSNKLGTTFESIHEVYMAISSDTEAEIHVREGIIFLTRDIANQVYTENGVSAVGSLKGRSNLEENKAYSDDLGHWYKNVGGSRSWNKSSTPDEDLIPMTWEELYKQIGKSNKNLKNELDKKVNKTDKASESTEGIVKYGTKESTALEGNKINEIMGTDNYGGRIDTQGNKYEGVCYYDPATKEMFLCIKNNNLTTANVTYFKPFSNKSILNRLENLYKPNFIKVTETEGILIGSKMESAGNFINVSQYFKQVYLAYFTPWTSKETYGASIVSYIGTDNDMNVLYWVRKFRDGKWHNIFSDTKDNENSYASCCYMIFGELK